MKNNKPKIVVLTDLNKQSESVIRSSASLAKMMNGEVRLFHVTKPTKIVETDNQFSAMRSINKVQMLIDKKIKNVINPISKDYDVKINYSSTIGNIKHEIADYISTQKPDVIVLGKRKNKPFKLIGDKLIDVVLKKHKGAVFIASKEHELQPTKVSLGILNSNKKDFKTEFVNVLTNKSQQPIKLFTIDNASKINENQEATSSNKTVEYIFEKGADALENVSKYASKSNINLMCVDTSKKEISNSNIKDIINNMNISLLLTGKQLPMLQS